MFAIVPIPGLNKQVFVLAGPLAGIKLPTEGASGDEVHKTNNTLGVTHSKKTMGTPMKDSQDGGRVVRFDMEHQDVESPSTPQRDTTSNVPSSIKVGRSTPKPLPDTPSSIMTSPTLDSEDSMANGKDATTDRTVTFEHSITSKEKSTGRRLSKPLFALIGAVTLLTTGSAAYFFTDWLSIPGLKTQVQRLESQVSELERQVDELTHQVDRLEDQVDRLGGEVDRLENATDRYAMLNGELNNTLLEYQRQNGVLNESLAEYASLNQQLEGTVQELDEQNEQLEGLVDIYSGLNQDLNRTVASLTNEVDRLGTINFELAQTNDDLWASIDVLSNETAALSVINDGLNLTVFALQDEVVELASEIDRLDALSEDLATVVSFLNETTITIDQTVDAFTDFLSQEITRNRILAMNSIRNLYRQRTGFWGCDFREYFLTEQFVQDRSAPIGSAKFPDVIDYVEEWVLSDLCLDTGDFVLYLAREHASPTDVSFDDMVQAVGAYTDLAMAYYFPSSNQTGLSPTNWGEAHYNCDNLPQVLLYRST